MEQSISAEHRARTQAELTRLLYAQSRPGIFAGLIVALGVSAVSWTIVPHGIVLGCLVAVLVANVIRLALVRSFLRSTAAAPDAPARDLAVWRHRYVAAQALVGAASGAAVVAIATYGDLVYQFFVLSILACVAAGNLATSVTALPAFAVFQIGFMGPTLVYFATRGHSLATLMASCLGLLVTILVITARRFNATLARSIELSLANDDLVKHFSAATERAEAARRALEAEMGERERAEAQLAAYARDLADKNVRLNEALELASSADRAKSSFLATMSHEIRTPLNALVGMASLLMRTELTREQSEFAETIRTSGDTLMSLISDILDFSKIEKGRVELQSRDFDVRAVVEDVVRLLASPVRAKGLELTYRIGREVPRQVRGDQGRVRQVLTNIVNNSVKFTDQGGIQVRVSAERPTSTEVVLRFEVEDTGMGIPNEALAAMFEPFVQADQSSSRRHGGAGLGLSIARELTHLMGGDIGAESQEGRYSRFWFTARVGARPDPGGERSPAALRGRRLLLVGVPAPIDGMLTELVEAAGMRAYQAVTGAEALEALGVNGRAADTDITIVEAELPDQDGVRLAQSIRADIRLAEMPIVIVSAGRRPDLAERARQAGVSTQLTRPLWASRLYRCIEAALRRPGDYLTIESTPPPHAAPSGVHPRVLLVEDNVVNQRVATRMLEVLECQVDVAATGREALVAMDKERYHLVLMDCEMPEMDGFATTIAIREHEGDGARTPIVAMTASATLADRERALASGMDDFVAKPVTLEMLQSTIEHWVSEAPRKEPAEAAAGPP